MVGTVTIIIVDELVSTDLCILALDLKPFRKRSDKTVTRWGTFSDGLTSDVVQ